MENYQFLALFGLIAGGFAWMTWLRSIDHRLNDLETRITVIELRWELHLNRYFKDRKDQ